MAKVVGPLHSSEARGSVGSLTYNTWRGICTVKTRSGPTTQYSADQVALRALTTLATAAWQALTDAQRDAWRDYADTHTDIDWTGNPKRITGYNWFVRINVRRQIMAQAISADPPTIVLDHSITNLSLGGTAPWLGVSWSGPYWLPPGDLFLEFYLAGPHSPGRHPNLPESDRKGDRMENVPPWNFTPVAAGVWTCFARPIHTQGVVGTFQRCTGTVDP